MHEWLSHQGWEGLPNLKSVDQNCGTFGSWAHGCKASDFFKERETSDFLECHQGGPHSWNGGCWWRLKIKVYGPLEKEIGDDCGFPKLRFFANWSNTIPFTVHAEWPKTTIRSQKKFLFLCFRCTRYAKDKDSSDSSRIYYEASFVEACNGPVSIGLGSKFEDYVAKLNADIEKHLESLYQAWGKRWEMIRLLEYFNYFL